MSDSKSLVMPKNMKEHCHLLFDTGVDAIFEQTPNSECVHKVVERGSSHPKHSHSLYIVVVVDVVQICNPLLVAQKHGTISDR